MRSIDQFCAMKTYPELAVLGSVEVFPRPGRRSHLGVGDHARVVLPNQKA
jgi:hypothetical protein